MKFLDDPRLYQETARCLAFARALTPPQNPPPRKKRTLFHFYWHGPFNRKAVFALKSFLATQDLERAEPWLWLDNAGTVPGSREAYTAALGRAIRILNYDPVEQAHDTPLETAPALVAPQDPVTRSDAFRILTLYRYGGLYVDIDTLFLRDFNVLLDSFGSSAFCYRWSGYQNASNAILYMERANPLGLRLMEHFVKVGSCHPRRALRHKDHADIDLLELPSAFFDPLWLHFDRLDRFADTPFDKFDDFFRPFTLLNRRKRHIRTIADFFPGAFAYQWHGRWHMPEYKTSYFGSLERDIEARLEARKQGAPLA